MPLIIALIVGLVLWVGGYAPVAGEIVTIIAATILGIQLLLVAIVGTTAAVSFRRNRW